MRYGLKRTAFAVALAAGLLAAGCGGGDDGGNNDTSGAPTTPTTPNTPNTPTTPTTPPATYLVEISGGGSGALGEGNYEPGAVVFISAGTPPSGYTFDAWTTSSRGVSFDNAGSATTWFTMPNNTVTVTANFRNNGNNTYEFVVIGGQKWMKKNLNIETADSWCWGNSPDSCAKYGRLYTWDAAIMACPAGWKLPDTADWNRLVMAAGGSSTAGKALKSKSGWRDNDGKSGNGTDDFGFSALPGGSRSSSGSFYGGGGIGGDWWTATEFGGVYAYYWLMNYDYDGVFFDSGSNNYKSNGFSVRCVEE